MRTCLKLCVPLLALFGAACADPTGPTTPTSAEQALSAETIGAIPGTRNVGVMTENLYIGADVDAVIIALATPDPDDDVPALLSAVATIEHTDFPARAQAIAREIKRERPDVVGLQEVSTVAVVIPLLGVDLSIDFQQVLLDALAAEGLDYVVAIRHDNFTASPAPGISLTDADMILVNPDRVEVLGASGHAFTANLGPVAPGVDLERGWVTVEGRVNGTVYTFVSVHTEGTGTDEQLAPLHAAQVGEMVASLGAATPAIIMGDFNSPPGTPAYHIMLDGGFTDVWAALRPGVRGYSCCHAADLSGLGPALVERVDYIWARGLGEAQGPSSMTGQVNLYGEVPSDRIENAAGELIWPSDHAGLIGRLLVPLGRTL